MWHGSDLCPRSRQWLERVSRIRWHLDPVIGACVARSPIGRPRPRHQAPPMADAQQLNVHHVSSGVSTWTAAAYVPRSPVAESASHIHWRLARRAATVCFLSVASRPSVHHASSDVSPCTQWCHVSTFAGS